MHRMYYKRDPKTSRDGRLLTIEGLDPELFDQGSKERTDTINSKNSPNAENDMEHAENAENNDDNANVAGFADDVGTNNTQTIQAPA